MVLLVLAIVWGVLFVSWMRSRTDGVFSDSVGTFQRHLTVLERATPASVAPANRLRTQRSQHQVAPFLPAGSPVAAARRRTTVGRQVGQSSRLASPTRSVATSATLRRRRSQKRRRDVLFVLAAGTAGSLLIALIPGMSAIWPVQVFFDLALGSYVAMLIRLRNLAAERELKVTFMSRNSRHGSMRPAYSYSDVIARRAAN